MMAIITAMLARKVKRQNGTLKALKITSFTKEAVLSCCLELVPSRADHKWNCSYCSHCCMKSNNEAERQIQ